MRRIFDKAVVIDIETDGLDRQSSKIIKVDAVQIDNDRVGKRLTSYAYVGHTVDAYIRNIVGVKQEQLESAPQIDLVLTQLAEHCRARVIIGVNLEYQFDFIDRDRPKGAKFGQNRIDLCTLGADGRYIRRKELLKELKIENGDIESIANAIVKINKKENKKMNYFNEARKYQLKGAYEIAYSYYLKGLNETNDPKCAYGVALFHKRGYFVEKDEKKADELFNTAFERLQTADESDADAMLILSFFYANGFATEENLDKFKEYTRKSAEAGNIFGQLNMMKSYSSGIGEYEGEKAKEWFNKIMAQHKHIPKHLYERFKSVISLYEEPVAKEKRNVCAIYKAGDLIDKEALEKYIEDLEELNVQLLEIDEIVGREFQLESKETGIDFKTVYDELGWKIGGFGISVSNEENIHIAKELVDTIEKINQSIDQKSLNQRLKIVGLLQGEVHMDDIAFQTYALWLRELLKDLYQAEDAYDAMLINRKISVFYEYMKKYIENNK